MAVEKSAPLGVLGQLRNHSQQPRPFPTAGMELKLEGRAASHQPGPGGRTGLESPNLHVRNQQPLREVKPRAQGHPAPRPLQARVVPDGG